MRKRSGQALIEAVVAFAIAMVALVSLLRLSNRAVGNSGQSSRQAVATSYATEAINYLKGIKTKGYPELIAQISPTPCSSFPCNGLCLNDITTWPPPQNCSTTTLGTEYDRTGDFSLVSGGLQVTVKVEWNEDGKLFSAKQTYIFVNK
jgi:Tfp pilus assembly protein PilV